MFPTPVLRNRCILFYLYRLLKNYSNITFSIKLSFPLCPHQSQSAVSPDSDNLAIHHAFVTHTYWKERICCDQTFSDPVTHQSVVKCIEKDKLVSIDVNIRDPNQACELSTTVLITMLISTSLLCLSPTSASSAAYCVKEQSVLGTNTPFTNKVYVSWGYVCECVLNVNGKMCMVLYLCSPGLGIFPHCVFFNCTVSRFLLSVTAARGAPLSDSDAD